MHPTHTAAALAGRRDGNQRRSLNDGWLHVEQSMSDKLDSYVTENALAFAGGWIEVRQFSWTEPTENVWSTGHRCYLLNMSLINRETTTLASNLTMRRIEGETVGRIFMVPPDQTMQCNNVERGYSRSIRCAIAADLVEAFLDGEQDPAWSEMPLRDCLQLSGGKIEWLLRQMYREVHEPDFASVQVIEALSKQLAAEIVRKFKLRREEGSYHVGGLAPWRIKLIRQRLQSDKEPPTLIELAEICDISVRHLGRAFRAETGQSIGRYIEATMVERANTMLLGGAPVSEVAASLGYARSGSFASAFRRATGLLPSEIKASRSRAAPRAARMLNS